MPRVFQPVLDTIEISMQGTYDGQLVENKFYVKSAATVTAPMVAEAASIVDNWVHSAMLPIVSHYYQYFRTVARDLTTEASFESVANAHANEIGSNTSNPLPGNATLAIHRQTGLSGKKAKSRIYWIGLAESALASPNVVTSASANLFVAACDTLRVALQAASTGTFTYGYPQRIIGGVKLTAGNFIPVLGHSVTDLFVDAQRKRLQGRGR